MTNYIAFNGKLCFFENNISMILFDNANNDDPLFEAFLKIPNTKVISIYDIIKTIVPEDKLAGIRIECYSSNHLIAILYDLKKSIIYNEEIINGSKSLKDVDFLTIINKKRRPALPDIKIVTKDIILGLLSHHRFNAINIIEKKYSTRKLVEKIIESIVTDINQIELIRKTFGRIFDEIIHVLPKESYFPLRALYNSYIKSTSVDVPITKDELRALVESARQKSNFSQLLQLCNNGLVFVIDSLGEYLFTIRLTRIPSVYFVYSCTPDDKITSYKIVDCGIRRIPAYFKTTNDFIDFIFNLNLQGLIAIQLEKKLIHA